MARSYTLKRRAEQQAQTRRRIVEAAVDLHGTVGPARTSLSMVAERAGVQRNTFYAHFPDEQSLLLACSAHFLAGAPPPEAVDWRGLKDTGERLRTGLSAVYDWYGRTADVTGCVLRDAEHHAPTREISELRLGPTITAWHEVLGSDLSPAQQALLHLALDFHSWRALVRETGLDEAAAADLMAGAIERA
ncbi:helix-turn-helix domain-containing protein [Brevundimonas sp.]|uniref:TetR/AcrR family transcriptional regulator n=1 Tax=Brevundimonas sp. TaxID=1871086 RepID=UPI002D2CB7C4|nr:helix-turn-helix domain-containing protein [Brevundimonas sp.]HYC75824.1 helix-turn-helix domain-containing protein [Brevundimonas sp.]